MFFFIIIDPYIDITFFAKHSGSTSGMLRNDISRGTLILLHEKDVSLNLDII